MKLNAETGKNKWLISNAFILFNGVKIDKVIEANEEEGYVIRYAQPYQRRISAPSMMVRHKLFGDVKICVLAKDLPDDLK